MGSGCKRDLGIAERFVAGSLAGAIAQSTIYPLEVRYNIAELYRYSLWDKVCLALRCHELSGLGHFVALFQKCSGRSCFAVGGPDYLFVLHLERELGVIVTHDMFKMMRDDFVVLQMVGLQERRPVLNNNSNTAGNFLHAVS